MTVLCLMENVVCNVKVELSANMKLLNAKNSELQSFIQRLNGNCSIIQVKILNIVLIDFRHHTQGFEKPESSLPLGPVLALKFCLSWQVLVSSFNDLVGRQIA